VVAVAVAAAPVVVAAVAARACSLKHPQRA
jgi:hypothetical protein